MITRIGLVLSVAKVVWDEGVELVEKYKEYKKDGKLDRREVELLLDHLVESVKDVIRSLFV